VGKEIRDIDLLVVAPYVPDFDRQSGSFRFHQVLQMLAQRYRVAFLGVLELEGHPAERYVEALKNLGIEVYRAPTVDIRDLLDQVRLGVLFEYYGPGIRGLRRVRLARPDLRIVVDSVDVHYLREIRASEFSRRPERARRRALRTMRRELRVYREADVVMTVTQEDRRELERHVLNTMMAVIPNVHRVREGPPPFLVRQSNSMLFVGAFTHAPNADAMLFFCGEILPLIREKLGKVRVTIVGPNPPRAVVGLASDEVVVTGWVPSVRPYLDSHRVVIAPLRFGAGMKGKVGEAMAEGVPVVTTSVGAEGMELEDGRTAMIGDSPEAFAAAVIRVCTDANLHARLSAEGQAHVRARWEFAAVEREVAKTFETVESVTPKTLSYGGRVAAHLQEGYARSRLEWKTKRLGSIAEWYLRKIWGSKRTHR
jgi:glycosyltransferase involved in cell wall biosynthesis